MTTILLLTGLLLFQEPTPKGHDLTLKDMIVMLADYDVRHEVQQPFFQPSYGATQFAVDPPAVYIFNTSDTASRRSTVIHEFLHVYYHQIGIDTSTAEGEEFIRGEETRLYLQIFGDSSKHDQ